MDKSEIIQLQHGLTTAFIDRDMSSNLAYTPEFISNDYQEGKKVLSSIEDELIGCQEFFISVAFITMSGITPLLQTLKELENRKIPGKILTTDYLCFSEPKALMKLSELNNVTLKMYSVGETDEGFHTKGYVFKNGEVYRIIVGSSNITSSALTQNREWNTKIVSTERGKYTTDILNEFDKLWNSDCSHFYSEINEDYNRRYFLYKQQINKQRELAKSDEIISLEKYRLSPNSMQMDFISNLKRIYSHGNKRALLISATGTGKTYASAFGIRELGFKRILFLVHRNQIASQALKSYKNVFDNRVSMGLVSGYNHDYKADFVFATMQTMSKREILEKYSPDTFEAIVIDEAHHSSADSYQRIIEYFKPQFWLGMTATPDKRVTENDDKNIYELFDYQIACEIRLQQAMEENLLCPFHYFGITDLELITDSNTREEKLRNFSLLTSDTRVDYIIEKANYYGYSGERVKGLIFCSWIDEAKELSKKFNERGLRTIVLCGDDSEEKRIDAIERLAGKDSEDALDYILSVDIFSEGVDIVEVNQVIMLRPTESPIVFIQQLGRGLRKAEGKEYVIILDFIGNYKNNFMIPVALYGDRTYNKDTIRRYVIEGSRILPGSSTIHFDEISKKQIFASIDKSSTTKKFLSEKYFAVKNKLGHIPNILEFDAYGEVDPLILIDYATTYNRFVSIIDKEYSIIFDSFEESVLEFVSLNLVQGKRPHELVIIKTLIEQSETDLSSFYTRLSEVENTIPIDKRKLEKDYYAAVDVLRKRFVNSQSEKEKYELMEIFDEEKISQRRLTRSLNFYERVKRSHFRVELNNLIEFGLKRYSHMYKDHDDSNLVLYQKYSRKDVCRLLNWERDDSSTIYGYRIKYNTCPIFVTYEKKDDIASSTKYQDQFLDNHVFSWMTRSRITLNSNETQEIINYQNSGLKIYLFIKKSDGEGTDFYYMGQAKPIKWEQTTIRDDKNNILPIVNFQLELANAVRNDIFDYFTK